MVTVTSVLRRSSAINMLDHDSSNGDTSRRPSLLDGQHPRRPSLGSLSLRLSRSKRFNSAKEVAPCSEAAAQLLGEAFFSLPDEIIVQIFCHLCATDIFALRLTSRTVNSFLQVHATPITQSLLMRHAYEHGSRPWECDLDDSRAQYTYNYIQTLYPHPLGCTSTDYLLQMLKRQSQIDRMLSVVASYVHMKIYMVPSCPRFDNFAPYEAKLIRRLHLAAWTVYHFLEKYREMLMFEHPSHPHGRNSSETAERPHQEMSTSCRSCADFVTSLLPLYPDYELIPAYHFYELCRQHLRSLSRAPAYAGSIERRLRGWSRKPPTEADLAIFVVLGAIPELCKLSMLKGTYNQRIEVIGSFVDKVYSEAARTRLANGPTSPPLPRSQSDAGKNSSYDSASLLTNSLAAPLQHISHDTLAAMPDLDNFVIDSAEWVARMFQLLGPEVEIVNAWGFVQNVLAGKEDQIRFRGEFESEPAHLAVEKGIDPDILAPVKGFD